MRQLLARFLEGLDAEIALLEKEGRDQTYDLTGGRREERSTGMGGLYAFLLGDPLRLPDDANGMLKVGGADIRAMVVSQEGNRLWILLESAEQLPSYIASARLTLSRTDLLVRLKERIEEMASGDAGMAPRVFGVRSAKTAWRHLPQTMRGLDLPDSMRLALEQALGSEVTFLWGPPGTGKTFSIATLVAALLQATNETVLVTSHTHAAVEQALWAAIEPPSDGRPGGLLHEHELVKGGAVLKVGPLRQAKIPAKCHLDSYLEEVGEERQIELTTLRSEQKKLDEEIRQTEAQLGPWAALAQAEGALEVALTKSEKAIVTLDRKRAELNDARAKGEAAQKALVRAEGSFFVGRKGRIARAQVVMREGVERLTSAERSAARAEAGAARATRVVIEAEATVGEAREATRDLPEAEALRSQLGRLQGPREGITSRISSLQDQEDESANRLLDRARCLFATLTKLYMDPKLRGRQWDTVIVDEVSMALPPLLALAAARARKRVVLVGDFYQLPPIIQSRDGVAHEELGVDIFERRGIVQAVESRQGHPQLAALSLQRRMNPGIADVARALVYREHLEDHPDVVQRQAPAWVDALGTSEPLVIVDTATLKSWCGKMRGSLSRFNFYSAQAAVELAAMYAARLPEPDTTTAPPIGIVTPYAAQRRYISRLVEEMGLGRWVAPGTVHTFQGNECDVIIFDSVLGEPHWTARYTNPHEEHEVRRDLNVAVTRARHQFVFVGDSAWLDGHARAGSGYGKLWAHLKGVAHRLDAISILGGTFRSRVAESAQTGLGWGEARFRRTMALLDETSFYPAFATDLRRARERAVLYTPFIGKTRWPQIEPHIASLRERGVEVFLLHKPQNEWREADPGFMATVLSALSSTGVRLVPLSGIHAKTIVIDSHIVYDGSLNWASQTASYEHMWRMESPDVAALVERMLQLDAVLNAFGDPNSGSGSCPECGGSLLVVNQTEKANRRWVDPQPLKLGCLRHATDRSACIGHVRGVHARAPFTSPPRCEKGTKMSLVYSASGKSRVWKCGHKTCKSIRWAWGDVES